MRNEETITYWMEEIAYILVKGGNLGHLLHCARMLEIALTYANSTWRELQYDLLGYAYAKEVL